MDVTSDSAWARCQCPARRAPRGPAHTVLGPTRSLSAVDVNAKNVGTSAAVQATLRLFRRLLYGAGLTRFVSPAMLFDLNTYCEDFIQAEFFKPNTRVKYALAVMGDTQSAVSTFFQRQANNLVATVMMLVRNSKKFAAAMKWTRGQLLDRVLPGKGDVPVAVMKQALSKKHGGAVTDAIARKALESFHAYMESVTALAHDCTLCVERFACRCTCRASMRPQPDTLMRTDAAQHAVQVCGQALQRGVRKVRDTRGDAR